MKEEIHTQLNPFVPERTAIPPAFTAKILCIAEGDKFLDVGFGTAEHAINASSLVGYGYSVGVDSEAYNVEQANILKNRHDMLDSIFKRWNMPDMKNIHRTAKNTAFMRGYAEELSKKFKEDFDKVLLSRVLRWTASEKGSLKEVYRITKYGGSALIIDSQDYSKAINYAGFEIVKTGEVPSSPDNFYLLRK